MRRLSDLAINTAIAVALIGLTHIILGVVTNAVRTAGG